MLLICRYGGDTRPTRFLSAGCKKAEISQSEGENHVPDTIMSHGVIRVTAPPSGWTRLSSVTAGSRRS